MHFNLPISIARLFKMAFVYLAFNTAKYGCTFARKCIFNEKDNSNIDVLFI